MVNSESQVCLGKCFIHFIRRLVKPRPHERACVGSGLYLWWQRKSRWIALLQHADMFEARYEARRFTFSRNRLWNCQILQCAWFHLFVHLRTHKLCLAAVWAWVFVCGFTLPPALWVLRQAFCPGLPRVSTPLSTWWMDRAEKRETGLIYSGSATGGLLWLIHIFIQRSGRRQDASAGPQTPGQRAGPKPWAQAPSNGTYATQTQWIWLMRVHLSYHGMLQLTYYPRVFIYSGVHLFHSCSVRETDVCS